MHSLPLPSHYNVKCSSTAHRWAITELQRGLRHWHHHSQHISDTETLERCGEWTWMRQTLERTMAKLWVNGCRAQLKRLEKSICNQLDNADNAPSLTSIHHGEVLADQNCANCSRSNVNSESNRRFLSPPPALQYSAESPLSVPQPHHVHWCHTPESYPTAPQQLHVHACRTPPVTQQYVVCPHYAPHALHQPVPVQYTHMTSSLCSQRPVISASLMVDRLNAHHAQLKMCDELEHSSSNRLPSLPPALQISPESAPYVPQHEHVHIRRPIVQQPPPPPPSMQYRNPAPHSGSYSDKPFGESEWRGNRALSPADSPARTPLPVARSRRKGPVAGATASPLLRVSYSPVVLPQHGLSFPTSDGS